MLVFGFSVVLEALQYFIPNRSVDAMDIASNALGIMVGWMAYQLLTKRKLVRN